MRNKEVKGIALILFGILLSIGGAEINDILLSSLGKFPFSLIGIMIGAVGLVMAFMKDTNQKS